MNTHSANGYFLRIEEVMLQTKLSRSSVYKQMEKRNFPLQVKLTTKLVVWHSIEIDDWMASKLNARDTIH